jgi:hypothetical protein
MGNPRACRIRKEISEKPWPIGRGKYSMMLKTRAYFIFLTSFLDLSEHSAGDP